ncbi:hypothetical protein D3C72_1001060 [compost metagenome]
MRPLGVPDQRLRGRQLRLGFLQAGLGIAFERSRFVHLLPGHIALGQQRIEPFPRLRRQLRIGLRPGDLLCRDRRIGVLGHNGAVARAQRGLGHLQAGRGLLNLQPIELGIDREQYLASAYLTVFAHVQDHDAARHCRGDTRHIRSEHRILGQRLGADAAHIRQAGHNGQPHDKNGKRHRDAPLLQDRLCRGHGQRVKKTSEVRNISAAARHRYTSTRQGSTSSMPQRTNSTRASDAPTMPITAQRIQAGKYESNTVTYGALRGEQPASKPVAAAGQCIRSRAMFFF